MENLNRLSRVHECYRRQTTDRQTDGRQHIANVNVSSRSLKTSENTIRKLFANNTHDELATLHSIAAEQQDLSMKWDDYLMRDKPCMWCVGLILCNCVANWLDISAVNVDPLCHVLAKSFFFVFFSFWCCSLLYLCMLYNIYRQHCAKCNAPVFNWLRGRFWGFSPRRGDTLHRLR